MKHFIYSALIGSALAAVSCAPQTEEVEIIIDQNMQQHSLQAVLFHQTAGEYKALCYQTYNLAKWQLDQKLANHAYPYEKTPAIVMDLDETVVDNSYFNAQLILDDGEFAQDKWNNWSAKQAAGQVPGAVEFINYAAGKGVKVIFISNRRVAELENTMAN
jgi:5'-nucleotidase (lipoprotein e(P4) family)